MKFYLTVPLFYAVAYPLQFSFPFLGSMHQLHPFQHLQPYFSSLNTFKKQVTTTFLCTTVDALSISFFPVISLHSIPHLNRSMIKINTNSFAFMFLTDDAISLTYRKHGKQIWNHNKNGLIMLLLIDTLHSICWLVETNPSFSLGYR